MITSWAPTPFIESNMPWPSLLRSPSTARAGNLLGTTRTHQPGPLRELPGLRKASTSGGVICSLPGQKGQLSLSPWATGVCAAAKSLGLFARSVAMTTHSRVIGSLRNWGIGHLWEIGEESKEEDRGLH